MSDIKPEPVGEYAFHAKPCTIDHGSPDGLVLVVPLVVAERLAREAAAARQRIAELERKLEASTILNDVDTIDRLQTRTRELEDSVATALSLIDAALDSSMLGTYPRADLQLARARLMRPQKPPLAPPEAPTEAQKGEKDTDAPTGAKKGL